MNSSGESPLFRLIAKTGSMIVPLAGNGGGSPFYCVHSIGGDVTTFRQLAQLLGTERKIYGIQAPRNRLGADFARSIHAIAAYYADALEAFQPEGPLLLGGWSVGAVIALEMAQMLRQRGRDVPLLTVIDGIVYNTGAGVSAWHLIYWWKLSRNLPNWIADNIGEGWGVRGVAKRIVREFRSTTASIMRFGQSAGTASAVDVFIDTTAWPPEQTEFAKSLYHALEKYEPLKYTGRVLVYASKTQPLFHLLQVGESWREISPTAEIVNLDGTHLSILREPRVRVLASDLRRGLAAADPAATDALPGNSAGCRPTP